MDGVNGWPRFLACGREVSVENKNGDGRVFSATVVDR